jgi:hypothetical protein
MSKMLNYPQLDLGLTLGRTVAHQTTIFRQERSKKGGYKSTQIPVYFKLLIFFISMGAGLPLFAQVSGSSSLCVGATTGLTGTGTGGSWSSSNTSAATVNGSTGIVTGIAAGSSTISYTISGITQTKSITVNPLPNAGTVTGANTVCILSSTTLTSGVTGGLWSTKYGIVTIGSSSGIVTGIAIGGDTISYTVTNSCGSHRSAVKIKVTGIVGNIYTYGGTGAQSGGDGGPAYLAGTVSRDMVADNDGNLFFCDVAHNMVKKISTDGIITTVAGNGTSGNGGDGAQATAATLNGPNGVFVDNSSNVYIANTGANTIRKVNGSTGIITTIAGTGSQSYSGDGGQASVATFSKPLGICLDDSGNIYIADQLNYAVRKINGSTGIITTVAGTHVLGYSGDGGQATAATLGDIRDVKMDNKGNVYIADAFNNAIRKYSPSTGIITTITGAGPSANGYSGDGGPATAALISTPARFAYDGANILYFSDQANNAIRQIDLRTGIINKVAGTGTAGLSGDNSSALTANISAPAGIAVDHAGNFFIADFGNSRIRVVPSKGSVSNLVTGPQHVCAGTSVTLSTFASVAGSISYQWQKNGTNIGSSSNSYTESVHGNSDVFRNIATITPACSSVFFDTSNDIHLIVDHPASAIAGVGTFACEGGNLSLTDSGTNGTWSSNTSSVATIDSAGILSGIATGAAIITFSTTNLCGSSTATATVTVNPLITISATVGPNGTIAPNPPITMCQGTDQVFTFTPNPGYHVAQVVVDGSTIAPTGTYTFTSVNVDHVMDNISFAPDCSAPAITVCPSNVTTNNASGSCNATATYTAATVTGTSPTITYSQNSGTSFSVGTTTVTVNATNSCGSATCSFTVTVVDNQNPTITAPSAVTVNANSGSCSATGYSLGTPTTADNCGVANVTSNDAGSYSVGAHTITWTVTDVNGNTATATQSITVVDNQNPTITAPSAVTVNANSGSCSATGYSLGTPTTADNCGVANVTSNDAGSYSVGAHTITWTVTDVNGNTATATQSITVVDNQNPTITAPSAVTVNANSGSCSATGYSLGTPTTADNCGVANVTNNDAGSYSVGVHTITWTVTDVNGNTATATQAITVVDNQNPTITAPAAITISGWCRAVSLSEAGYSLGTPTTADNCGVASVTNNAPSTFSVGTTTVTWTVTDVHGHTATATQIVTVTTATVSISAAVVNVSCNSANGGTHNNGSITTTATGGTAAYSYVWSNGSTGANLTGLSAGSYTVTATDAHSCIATVSATVIQPSAVSITSIAGSNISCNSANGGNHSNGSIATAITGGTGSYSYSWTGGASGANPSSLATGVFSVTVTDASSCTTTGSATVGQPAALAVAATATGVTCGGSNTDGSIATTISGGTSSYTCAWSYGSTSANPTGLATGTYSVTVTDANSCTTTASATVAPASTISSTITGNASVLGSIANTYTGPSGMTSYSWSITGGDHVCDVKCHHATGHTCGVGCDHYGVSCPSGCHHHSGHTCTYTHTGDHHCSVYCHHNSGHSCAAGCDHYGVSCTSACHHNSGHRCGHAHCGSTVISGSATGSSISVVSPCCAAAYTITLTTANSGGCTSTSNKSVAVIPSATITVYSALYTTGSGNHPTVSKSALDVALKVYDRNIVGPRNFSQTNYSTVWNSTTGVVANVSVSSPESVTLGSGLVNKYTITVPAYGNYLVVGQSTISSSYYSGSSHVVYTARKVGGHVSGDILSYIFDDDVEEDITPCSNNIIRFHQILKDQRGKLTEADTHQEYGSLMMVVTPVALSFDDSVAYLPVVYESVEGDWSVSVSADPPYGFYAEPSGSLSTSVTDSVINAVQFAVTDTGSEWTFTRLTHKIFHKGAERTALSQPGMVNDRTNKPTEVKVMPNPADDQIRVILSKFEGKATINIYDVLGRKVAEQPIHILSGESVAIDISSLLPGVYMVSAENSTGKATTRLIKRSK